MKIGWKQIVLTLAITIIAFLMSTGAPIGKHIWPPNPESPAPTSVELPFFLLLSFIEALSFGIAISFLVFGWRWVRKVANQNKRRAVLMMISIFWLLANWFPHDNLHIHNGENMKGLLFIEYGFHGTLIIAGIIVAFGFLGIIRESVPNGRDQSV